MTNQNDNSNPDLHVKLMQDARTRKWQVKIRNLTKEQIDFIAGPRLLPTLSKADAVVIDHVDTTITTETTETVNPELPVNNDTSHNELNAPTMSEPSKSDGSNTESCNPIISEEAVKPDPKPAHPHRSMTKVIDYSSMTAPEDTLESDSDDYTPLPDPPPKLNNKHYPSASRIAAQRHKKPRADHGEPKQSTTDNDDQEAPADKTTGSNVPKPEESTKGELNITTVEILSESFDIVAFVRII